jgi:predicted phosphoadenosine phosphosulfate sulfurtransferase
MYATNRNVHTAALERIQYVFENFDNVYVSLSGGKDSGVLLNLTLDYMRTHGIQRKIGVFFCDLEAFYKKTIAFIEQMMLDNADLIDPYWVCMPMLSPNSVSMYEPYWMFWDPEKKEKWVRPMPTHPFIIHADNHQFDFWRDRMTFEEFIEHFGPWYAKKNGGRTACLVGVRTDESLNRWRAIVRQDKGTFQNCHYSTAITEDVFNFYPIYDWKVEDIWTYNGKFDKPYNQTYDLMYKAGVPLSKQRICEPFGDEQKAGLNLFKVIEPETWVRVVDRVSGANFGNIYCDTKALGRRAITLPAEHSWKSYCKFLLKTLPDKTRAIYMNRFVKFLKWWHRKGSPVNEEHIAQLPADAIINTKAFSVRGKGDKHVVKFRKILDELPGLDTKADFPTWKRLCMTILKNDITCKSLHFGLTKHEVELRANVLNKYKGF